MNKKSLIVLSIFILSIWIPFFGEPTVGIATDIIMKGKAVSDITAVRLGSVTDVVDVTGTLNFGQIRNGEVMVSLTLQQLRRSYQMKLSLMRSNTPGALCLIGDNVDVRIEQFTIYRTGKMFLVLHDKSMQSNSVVILEGELPEYTSIRDIMTSQYLNTLVMLPIEQEDYVGRYGLVEAEEEPFGLPYLGSQTATSYFTKYIKI
ncbi:MAG: hypothetical protein ACTSYO_09840, partial [Candidatus Ranarchaeia archaeon]